MSCGNGENCEKCTHESCIGPEDTPETEACSGCGNCSCGSTDVVQDYAEEFANKMTPLLMDYQRDIFSNPALMQRITSQNESVADLSGEPELVRFFDKVHMTLGWERENSNNVAEGLLHRLHLAITVKTEF